MPNELQVAIAECANELQESAGETFVFGASTFRAWPVQLFEFKHGRLPSAHDSVKTYEAIHAIAPAFANGDKLTTAGGSKRVAVRHQPDPTTGLFRFSVS